MASKTRRYDPRYKTFCDLLRKWRKEAQLSQTDLGTRIGKGVTWVSKNELGERRMDTLETLAWIRATGVPFDRAMRELNAI